MEKKIGYYDLKKEFGSASITYDQNNGVAKCKSGSNYYTFDDPVTIATKISWALEKQLGGAMAWRCDQDKDRVLRDAVVTALNAAGGSSNNNNNNSGSSSPVNLKFDSGYTPDYVEYFDTSRGTGTLYKTSQIDGFTWSSTNGGSLKCSVNSSATSISIYIKYTNAPQNGLVKFDAWAKNNNFGKSIRKVSAIEQYTASGEFVKSLIGSGRNVPYANDYKFGAIEASSSLDGSSTSGWIRLKFARDAAASG